MRRAFPLLAFLLAPAAAMAHTGIGAHGSPFASGLAHPLLGTDHLLTMVAVGIFAATAGGRAVWALPASFVGAMLLGGVLGLGAVALPVIEPAILASVVVLGVAIALAIRPPLPLACAVVGAFGVAHGYAHGLEAPALGGLGYFAGFGLATAALHAGGLGIGLGAAALGRPAVARALGAFTAAAGLALAFT